VITMLFCGNNIVCLYVEPEKVEVHEEVIT
jgi:hypothetical protein